MTKLEWLLTGIKSQFITETEALALAEIEHVKPKRTRSPRTPIANVDPVLTAPKKVGWPKGKKRGPRKPATRVVRDAVEPNGRTDSEASA